MNSYIFVNYIEICKFHYVSKFFDNMKKTRLYAYVDDNTTDSTVIALMLMIF